MTIRELGFALRAWVMNLDCTSILGVEQRSSQAKSMLERSALRTSPCT